MTRPVQRVAHHARLGVPSHQRELIALLLRHDRPRLQRDPDRDGVTLALRLDGRRRLIPDRTAGCPECPLVHQHAVNRRRRLEPRGGVDHVPHGIDGPAPSNGHKRLAGCHPHAHVQSIVPCIGFRVGKPVAYQQAAAHRPFRIVLMGDHPAEHGHHAITRELRHDATSALDAPGKQRLVRRKEALHILHVEVLRPPREPNQVREQDRHHPPLTSLRDRCRGKRRPTAAAEPEPVRVPSATLRTEHHRGQSTDNPVPPGARGNAPPLDHGPPRGHLQGHSPPATPAPEPSSCRLQNRQADVAHRLVGSTPAPPR